MIVGVDEVGRGCLAGPVCVAAVSLDVAIKGLGDSKKIPAPTRERLAVEVKKVATYVSIGWAGPGEVDRYGIVGALRRAALRALEGCDAEATEILLDGRDNYIHDPRVRTIIRGDDSEPAISAASIVAKVARDHYMHALHAKFPNYGFGSHVGYATKQHRDALVAHGPCLIHRFSFEPLRSAYGFVA